MTKKDFKACWETGDILPVAFVVHCSEHGEMDYVKFCEKYAPVISLWDRGFRGIVWQQAASLVGLAPHKVQGKNKTQWHDIITAEWLGDFKQIQTDE